MVSEVNHGTTEKIVVEKIKVPEAKWSYLFCKRFLDIALSLIAFVIAFIPMCLVAIAIRLESKGPVIYKQVRLGKNEKPFTLYKFRSMRVDAEKNGMCWAAVNDPRVTKVGNFIRKVRLDELPQLVNILSGKMSIVGPRPERPEFYDKFDEYIDGFRMRMYVKPGLTGLAQVNGGYDLLPEEKILYDMEYIRTQSLKQDMKIVFQTVAVILGRKGAR